MIENRWQKHDCKIAMQVIGYFFDENEHVWHIDALDLAVPQDLPAERSMTAEHDQYHSNAHAWACFQVFCVHIPLTALVLASLTTFITLWTVIICAWYFLPNFVFHVCVLLFGLNMESPFVLVATSNSLQASLDRISHFEIMHALVGRESSLAVNDTEFFLLVFVQQRHQVIFRSLDLNKPEPLMANSRVPGCSKQRMFSFPTVDVIIGQGENEEILTSVIVYDNEGL